MNVFGILSSDDEETLTEENYCEKTNTGKIIISKKTSYTYHFLWILGFFEIRYPII